MKPPKELKTWLYLELINHPTFDEMLDTTKDGRTKISTLSLPNIKVQECRNGHCEL